MGWQQSQLPLRQYSLGRCSNSQRLWSRNGSSLCARAYVLAWPSVESGALPIEGGVTSLSKGNSAAKDPIAKREELEGRLKDSLATEAESFAVTELIDPRETRPVLCDWVEWIQPNLDTLVGPVTFPMKTLIKGEPHDNQFRKPSGDCNRCWRRTWEMPRTRTCEEELR